MKNALSDLAHKKRTNFSKNALLRERKVRAMATIREIKVDGKVATFQFVTFLGRDAEGKQVRKYLTWKLSFCRARKRLQ